MYQMGAVVSNAIQAVAARRVAKISCMEDKMMGGLKAFVILLGFVVFVTDCNALAAQDTKVGASGNPIPRFVYLSTDEANMRTGPGRQYPIEWVFRLRDLPLEVVDEFGPWRKVRDQEGTLGWIHVQLLSSNKRTALIIGNRVNLYTKAARDSRILLIAEKGVVGTIVECDATWCRLEIEGARAWIARNQIWGVYPNELID